MSSAQIYIRVAAAFPVVYKKMTHPDGYFTLTVHAAAISVHLFPDAGKMIFMGKKKCLRLIEP
jgi:hypothetical protein